MPDMPNPSKNPEYPYMYGRKNTLEEVVAYYKKSVNIDGASCQTLADITAWLAEQPFASQMQAYGILGMTYLFRVDDPLLEGPLIRFSLGAGEDRFGIQFMTGYASYPHCFSSVSCTESHLRGEMQKFINRLLA